MIKEERSKSETFLDIRINKFKEKNDVFLSKNSIYKNNLEHIFDELYRIDLIVRHYIKKKMEGQNEEYNDFRGLFISEDEINSILRTQFLAYENIDTDTELDNIEKLNREIKRQKVESTQNGMILRLHILEELFELTSFQKDVLLICMAAELDLHYEKLYSYLQNDVTKKRPSIDLTIKLLCHSAKEGYKARENFTITAPLIKNHIIHLISDRQEDEFPLLSKYIKVDERIINYLLESNEIDSKIWNFSTLIKPKQKIEDLILPEELKNRYIEFAKLHGQNNATMFFFQGSYGTGKKTIAEAFCNEFGTTLLVVDSKVLFEDQSFKILTFILRECLLQDSSLFLEGFDVMMKNNGHKVDFKKIFEILDTFPQWVFLSGEKLWEPPRVIKNHNIYSITLNLPSYKDRKRIWESFLNGILDTSKDVDIDALATKFKFSGGQIRDAIFTASNIALAKNSGESLLSMEDLYQGCKAQSNKKLNTLTKKLNPIYIWEDLVLPDDIKAHLREISAFIKYKGMVYTDWGFDKKLSGGRGLNVLFSGKSGTGKTMAAEVLAREVELDIYKIDLSSVVSKYVGETEKNLQKIFNEAETSNAILFFDEADSLFGKRSEVKDAHDRYANIETGYLLQKMEEYEGVVVLATNLSTNIDDAFLRRMQFVIEFPFPEETQREKIWKSIFPKDAPLAQDIDYKFLSGKLKLAGGNIKNIALSAAFYAAGEEKEIEMQYIMQASKREYRKMGKTFLKADFEPYYDLIKTEER